MTDAPKADTSQAQLVSKNPATDEYLGSIPSTSEKQISTMLDELQQAQTILAQRTEVERKKLVNGLQFIVTDACDEVSLVVNKSTGKSRQTALSEIFLAAQALSSIETVTGSNADSKQLSVIICSPDYPILLPLRALYTAIVAGRSVMLVANVEAAMVARLLERLIIAAPALAPFVRVAYVDSVEYSNSFGREFVEVEVTSAFETDWAHGGQMPLNGGAMIVLDSADSSKAAKAAVTAACRNAGQCPTAVERIYVGSAHYQAFVAAVTEVAQQLTFGYSDEKKDLHNYGPLISAAHAAVVQALIDSAVASGARIHWGGERDRLFVQPTILVDVTSEMEVVQTASNSPLIVIIPVDSSEDAVRQANQNAMHVCYVWGGGDAAQAAQQVNANEVLINQDSAEFTISAASFGKILKPPANIIEQLNQPGNYRLLKTVLMAQYGTTPAQRLSAIELFRNSYKVQQVLNRVSEQTAKLFKRG